MDFIAKHRSQFPQQAKTDGQDLAAAIAEFEAKLPGWWFTIGVCSRSADASCGPDLSGPDYQLCAMRLFDEGFHCDDANGTMASSLRTVMNEAIEAKTKNGRALEIADEVRT